MTAAADHDAEEPEYRVVRRLADIEVRQYAAYTVAEVEVAGPAAEAGSQAFPILAAYLSGQRGDGPGVALAAAVMQFVMPVDPDAGASDTPDAAPGHFVVRLVVPTPVAPDFASDPRDARVRIREIQPGQVAVVRYSGFWSESSYIERLATLQAALRAAKLEWAGEAVYSRYNAPFQLWFMRRNEISLPLAIRS